MEEDSGPAPLEADIHLDCTVAAAEGHIRRAGQEEGLEEEDTVRTEAVQGVGLRKAAAAEGIPGAALEAARHTLPEAVPVEDIPVEDPDNTTCPLPKLERRQQQRGGFLRETAARGRLSISTY